MPCGAVTAQGCFGVSSVSSDKWSKWNRTIENLSRSFVLIGVQGLALLNLLSWPRQNPPVTIWLLLKLVDKMQARLKLPSANWSWLYRPYTLRLLQPDTQQHIPGLRRGDRTILIAASRPQSLQGLPHNHLQPHTQRAHFAGGLKCRP